MAYTYSMWALSCPTIVLARTYGVFIVLQTAASSWKDEEYKFKRIAMKKKKKISTVSFPFFHSILKTAHFVFYIHSIQNKSLFDIF